MQNNPPQIPQRSPSPSTLGSSSDSDYSMYSSDDSLGDLSSTTASLGSQIFTAIRGVRFAPAEQLEQIQTIENFSYPVQVHALASVNKVLNRMAQKLEIAQELGVPISAPLKQQFIDRIWESKTIIANVKEQIPGLSKEDRAQVKPEFNEVGRKFNALLTKVRNLD